MEIWIPVIVAIVSSLVSYFSAVAKGESDLKALEIQHQSDLARLAREQKHDLDNQNASEIERVEKMLQTDLLKEVVEQSMKMPQMQKEVKKALLHEMQAKKSSKRRKRE
ncbi:hypothetical protein [Jeotgalibacillus marinus]|uniref:Uncharacterized protein n=1 Tax=Jeotgalibacillus marinus TaxID=86667 RepID=A0ABV3Q6H4_9BACL